MARHVFTDTEWDFTQRAWVFYEATQIELATMRQWCEEVFGSRVEFGTQDMVRTVDFNVRDLFQQAFVFRDRDDAMRFKLSW